MFLSIHEMELRKVRFERAFPPDAIQFLDAKLRQAGPLEVVGTAELMPHTEGEIRIQGHLAVRMEADCDVCLEAAPYPVDLEFDLLYEPANRELGHQEVALEADDSELDFYVGDGLELEDVLREQVLLALPMQRICRENCQGLCPVCGANRNYTACGCRQEAPDDRWAALRQL